MKYTVKVTFKDKEEADLFFKLCNESIVSGERLGSGCKSGMLQDRIARAVGMETPKPVEE